MKLILDITLYTISASIFCLMFYGWLISLAENEKRAAGRFFLLAILLSLPYLILALLHFPNRELIASLFILATFLVALFLFFPSGRNRKYIQGITSKQIDERDTMFSRNELKPGTDRFEEYYKNKPENKPKDDNFRAKAGLLKQGSSQYNPIHFASADASFETIAALKNKVDGPVSNTKTETEPENISNYIKAWSKKLGTLDCGITTLDKHHLYSIGGRAERYGKPVVNDHQFAIAFTVEMAKELVDAAPSASIVMESGQQYLESGIIALQVAAFIRNLGYQARAHIDGNYQVVCPLVARDAGLGEIGRMGLLMTPRLGPRVRISVVTTNLPLTIDKPLQEYSTLDFCEKCKKCADACPSQAISFDCRKEIDGALRWQINQEACFTLWCQLGTDCGRCMSVCPYSHSDNFLHNMVRSGLKESGNFRTVALKMDDFFYGRKPASSPLPGWAEIKLKK